MNEEELLELIRKIKKTGCEESLRQLLDALEKLIRSQFKGHYEEDDLCQKTFLAVWRNLKRFEFKNKGGLFAWVKTIASNKIKEHIRKANRIKGAKSKTVPMENHGDVADPDSLGNSRHYDQTLKFDLCMKKLSEKSRRIIVLSYKDGLPPSKIAGQLKITRQTVRNIKLKAISQLENCLQGGEY